MSELRKTLDAFAQQLTKRLQEGLTRYDTPLQDVTDAFKALTAYYSAGLKDKEADPNADQGTFADFRNRVLSKEEPDGSAEVRTGRGRN